MKKYHLFLIVIAVLSLTSCEKFLDVKTQGFQDVSNFFNTDRDAIRAISACYYELPQESLIGRDIYWEQGCCNDFVWGRTRDFNTLATLHYTGQEKPLLDAFGQIYARAMNRCNWVIQGLTNRSKERTLSAIETRSLGEALFLRAYYHFLIAYRYGTRELGVPFIAYETVEGGYNNQIPPQTESVMKDYELIIEDLTKAESLLPRFEEYGVDDRGRAHKAAAVALMSKVYAYWAGWDPTQWTKVIECVNKLDAQTPGSVYDRDLHPSFSELFTADATKFWTKEYCFSFPSYGGKNNNGGGSIEFPGVCLENKGWSGELPAGLGYNGWGQFKPTEEIYQEMAKDNVTPGVKNERLAKSILEYGDAFTYFGQPFLFHSSSDIEAGFQINKYMEAFIPEDASGNTALDNEDWPCTRINWPIIRFADCLLLRAEANLVAGNGAAAAQDINRIRLRSNLKPITGVATWTDLYHERRCELAFELAADHAYDCKRWAVFGDPEIQALALKELNTHPQVRHHANRADPMSSYTVGDYQDYMIPEKVWNPRCLTFPYPSSQIAKSNGLLRNPPSWQ